MEKQGKRQNRRRTRLRLELLEPRTLFSVDGLAPLSQLSIAGHTGGCCCPVCSSNGTHADSGLDPSGQEHAELTASVDQFGNRYYFDPIVAEGPLGEPGDGGGEAGSGGEIGAAFTLDDVPILHSNPTSQYKIYLDFNGHTVTGTSWNASNQGNPIHAPAYDINGDIFSFSQTELDRIFEIWERVSEDFAPFDVDVTTEDPGVALFAQGNRAIRTLISTSTDDTRLGGTGHQWFDPAGGVAYVGSWTWNSDTPAWVFSNHLGGGIKKVAEAASHEIGHTLGLNHDGQNNGVNYYEGHGSGATGWAPIMGTGYYQSLTQWSRGEYSNANNVQDDLIVITRNIPYRSDDHTNTVGGAATPVTITETGFSAKGLIEQRSDVDFLKFDIDTFTTNLTLNILPWHNSPNLDIEASLYNEVGVLVQSSNPANSLSASFQLQLNPGTYYLSVQGVGNGNPLAGGYSDYASLGSFSVAATTEVVVGDVNHDGAIDDLDIDATFAAIRASSSDSVFDLNQDATIDRADVDFLVYEILDTLYGDANLDRQVDAIDFDIWQENMFGSRRGWSTGDFDGSTRVDVSDFNIWSLNRFTAPAPAKSTSSRRTPRAPLSQSAESESAPVIDVSVVVSTSSAPSTTNTARRETVFNESRNPQNVPQLRSSRQLLSRRLGLNAMRLFRFATTTDDSSVTETNNISTATNIAAGAKAWHLRAAQVLPQILNFLAQSR